MKSPSEFSAFSVNSSVTPEKMKRGDGGDSSYKDQIMAISNDAKTPMVQNGRKAFEASGIRYGQNTPGVMSATNIYFQPNVASITNSNVKTLRP